MMHKIIGMGLAGLALIVTGCESPKEDVKAKNFVVIAQHVDSMACSFFAMDTIERTYGLTNIIYHEEDNPETTCSDYDRIKYFTCYTTELDSNNSNYGSYACALGADSIAGGQDKATTQKKKYHLLMHHFDADYCGKYVVDKVAEDNGYKNVSFYAGDADTSCSDFPDSIDYCHDKYVQTHVVEGRVMGDDYSSVCVIGTDTPPEKKGLW